MLFLSGIYAFKGLKSTECVMGNRVETFGCLNRQGRSIYYQRKKWNPATTRPREYKERSCVEVRKPSEK